MERTPAGRILVIGCGYLGAELLKELTKTGWDATGITLSETSAAPLRQEGLRVLAIDVRTENLRALGLNRQDVIIHCASSRRGGPVAYREIFLEATERLLQEIEFQHFVFTSSTSVYAQTDGSMVTEESPAEPQRETGRILRRAEEMVLAHRGTVLRLSGLYGPSRCVPLQKLLRREAGIEGDGKRIINSIYRDDAVSACSLAAIQRWRGVFNVTDNDPVTQLEWFQWVCARLKCSLPPFVSPDPDRKRGWTSKRVGNAKLRSRGWSPRYPSFREGMERELAQDMGGSGLRKPNYKGL
jgi:nucleoside-diphosphate-sugar epimerase